MTKTPQIDALPGMTPLGIRSRNVLDHMSPAARDALAGALATRGKGKGRLLRKAPPIGTAANAAWHGAMLSVNPYKVSIGAMILNTQENTAIGLEVQEAFDRLPHSTRIAYDADRASLERLGVW